MEEYGAGLFVGADLSEKTEDVVYLKFEGMWRDVNLHEGYGSGIIQIDKDEFDEKRVYPEQTANGDTLIHSTEKRDQIFEERFKDK